MTRPLKPFHPTGEVRLVTSDGVRLHARWYPGAVTNSGAPCYLLGHGFTGSSGAPKVIAIAERFSDGGCPVLSLDFRGHGRSAGRSSVGVTEIADVAAGVAWLRLQHPNRPVIVLGFSMGACIVVRYAGLGGDADAVIAVPMLVVHGVADPYFSLAHPRMLAAAAPHCQLWLEPGMGHAESATSTELLDRMADWGRASVQPSASMA